MSENGDRRARDYVLLAVLLIECSLVAASGIFFILDPDRVATAIRASVEDTTPAWVFGMSFLACAMPLFQMIYNTYEVINPKPANQEQQRVRLTRKQCAYMIWPPICAVILWKVYTRWPDATKSVWWPASAVLGVFAIILFWSGYCVNRNAPRDIQVGPRVTTKGLPKHQVKLKYAWDWFQYHADQRLKAFNYFVVVFGILIASYGAALNEYVKAKKESAQDEKATQRTSDSAGRQSEFPDRTKLYKQFAIAVAVVGAVISIGFLLIEVRNTELVEVGRRWLDHLEKGLGMSLRDDDEERTCLPKAVGWLTVGMTPPKWLLAHKFWLRLVYCVGVYAFVMALFYAIRGFK